MTLGLDITARYTGDGVCNVQEAVFKKCPYRIHFLPSLSSLLHINQSDALTRRQSGTMPSDIASGPHSHLPNGAQCVHSRQLVW